MPVVKSNYHPKYVFKNGHVATIYSGLVRKIKGVKQERERFTLSDGDFIDLDWSYSSNTTGKLVVLLHGLEGDSSRPYMLASAKIFNQNNYDALCVNFRGCGGETNKYYKSYHSGHTLDLRELLISIADSGKYHSLFVKGISLGGNVILKYLGELDDIPVQLKAAMALSAPCHLYGSCVELHKFNNKPYAIRFLRYLLKRLKEKQKLFPEEITKAQINSIKTLKDFDDVYTSKAHGFKDAIDYYEKSSSLYLLQHINIPTLILNAKDDSFLSESCYPVDLTHQNDQLYLEMPKHGGHVGFYLKGEFYYNELRALEFFNQYT